MDSRIYNRILLLLVGLVPAGVGMLVIGVKSIRKRDKKLTKIVNKIIETLYVTKEDPKNFIRILRKKDPFPSTQKIDELEFWIMQEFQARV